MNTVNAYENLYNQMKNIFTVVNDNCEYTLGEYMLMKAGHKKANSNLPVARTSSNSTVISAFFKYVNDKLAVKEPPVKDKTIRKFPLRTSCAALLSALVASTLLLSCGSFTMRGVSNTPPATAEMAESEENFNFEHTYELEK